jgi:hypothetical protein
VIFFLSISSGEMRVRGDVYCLYYFFFLSCKLYLYLDDGAEVYHSVYIFLSSVSLQPASQPTIHKFIFTAPLLPE